MDLIKENIDRYIERYCKTYGYTRKEAEKHKIVQDVAEYYKETYASVL